MAIKCPGCTTELSPEASSCYVCMRPRTRNEIFKGIHGEQLEVKSRRRRPFIVAAVILIAAGGGYAWWKFNPLLKPLLKKASPIAPAAAPAGPQQAFEEQGASARRVEMFATEQPAASPSAAAPSSPSSAQEPSYTSAPPPSLYKSKEAPTKWKISGRVYDLITLKPVAGASVSFTEPETGKRREVKTGKDGRYSVALPSLKEGGYAPELSHPAYRPGFLEEGEVPYREQGESRRIEAAQLLRENVIMHVPLSPPEGESALTYDAVLTPVPR